MKLNLLSIEGSRAYEKQNDVVPIRARTHYLTEQFLHYLTKIDLDGSSKLVICFEEKPKDTKKYVCDTYFHVSVYYVDKDVLDRFRTLEQDMMAEYFLGILVDACSNIAHSCHRDEEVVKRIGQAADQIRENHFELVIPQKKLSKTSGDKRWKASVFRRLDSQGELWYVELEDKKANIMVRHELTGQYTNISLVDFYKKAAWEGNRFVLRDRLGRETFSLPYPQRKCMIEKESKCCWKRLTLPGDIIYGKEYIGIQSDAQKSFQKSVSGGSRGEAGKK